MKKSYRALLVCLILSAAFSACRQSVGFGETIDFEAPVIKVTSVVLADGTEKSIEETDGKLIIGPGTLNAPGCTLKGEASDNILVERIVAEETGSDAEIWDNAVISKRDGKGKQTWSISLDNIKQGERNISITAYDRVKNVGPNMVTHITLLVDTNTPFIESVRIERQAGQYVDLLSMAKLEELDPLLFDHIDYFQNESFTLRASVTHDFDLSSVTLNFLNEQGETVFERGLEPSSGTLFSPAWFITAEDLIAANPVYAAGRHYLKAVITAVAIAGHSGQNDVSNLLYNLCWYPEADTAQIQLAVPGETDAIMAEKNNVLPLRVFDDDNVNAVYAGLIPVSRWNEFMDGTDEEKLQWLYNDANREAFTNGDDGSGEYPLRTNHLERAARNAVIPVTVGAERGEYRLAVLAQDKKEIGDAGVWSSELFTVHVLEKGIPVISVESPQENTSPALTAGSQFTVSGSVMNLDEVEFLKMAWIPAGTGWDASRQITEGENALRAGAASNGIQIWNLDLVRNVDEDLTIGGTVFKNQSFNKTFDILTDFEYNGTIENKPKFFMLYTRGSNGDDEVFASLRLLPYTNPPVITIESPDDWQYFGSEQTITFTISAVSEYGADIKSVKLESVTDGKRDLALNRGTGNVWTAEDSHSEYGEYEYRITVTDTLNNTAESSRYVVVTVLPDLKSITSPHAGETVFSGRDTITIQAVFSEVVKSIIGTPRLVLGGFIDNVPRYADYQSGEGSTTLNFVYKAQAGDKTNSGGRLTVTTIDLNGGTIAATIPQTFPALPSDKALYVDAVAPRITGISFTGNGDPGYTPWLKEGDTLEIKVIADKELRVLENPRLELKFDGDEEPRYANFQNISSDDTAMVFSYKVQAEDTADPVICNASSCFSATDLESITDKAGAQGNYLILGDVQPNEIKIDTDPPAKLVVNELSSSVPRRYQINANEIESHAGTIVEYTLDGMNWTKITAPYNIPDISAPDTYTVAARQTDRAGNIGPVSVAHNFTITNLGSLTAVTCDNPDGAYTVGAALSFKLLFSGQVNSPSGNSGPSITIGQSGSSADDVTLRLGTDVTSVDNAYSLNFTWPIEADLVWNPLVIKDIKLTGVTLANGDTPSANIDKVKIAYNGIGSGTGRKVRVLSKKPTITNTNTNNPLASGTALVLTFSQPVWPENGTITVKPSDDWLIPPVLTSEQYYNVTKNLSAADKIILDAAYTKTTHGLSKDANGKYTGIPDTATKYVLAFGKGLDDPGNELRPLFNKAKYLWQEIDVHSNQVTGGGTATITVNIDPLPDGRIWDIDITGRQTAQAGAFRDGAGNLFDAWENNTFWSAKTAAPVIRVNRISSNDHSNLPATTVQVRIDCETPNAVIRYAIDNLCSSNVLVDITAASIDSVEAPYEDGVFFQYANGPNGSISETDLSAIDPQTIYAGDFAVGDGDLFTARKDYIAAAAKRDNLDKSDHGYEGAFKTLVVYKGPIRDGYTWLKIEGSNIQDAVPTVDGFPLSNNDLSGKTSKYFYKDTTTGVTYWIWISWEIVSNLYHAVLSTNQTTIDGSLVSDSSWRRAAIYKHFQCGYGDWYWNENGF